MGRNNLSSTLGDSGLFSLDAWHIQFDNQNKEADLFVHLNFGTGRMGGENNSPVTFDLRLRRATLVVRIPNDDGFKVDFSSVARTEPTPPTMAETKTEVATNAKFGINATAANTGFTGEASVGADGHRASTTNTTKSENLYSINVIDGKYENAYCWHLTPVESTVLLGTPWSAEQEPRLKILDKRTDDMRDIDISSNMTAPTIIELHCLREDFEISNLQLMNETSSIFNKLPIGKKDIKLTAAESYIREKLMERGLESGDISSGNKYVKIQLAVIRAEAQ